MTIRQKIACAAMLHRLPHGFMRIPLKVGGPSFPFGTCEKRRDRGSDNDVTRSVNAAGPTIVAMNIEHGFATRRRAKTAGQPGE